MLRVDRFVLEGDGVPCTAEVLAFSIANKAASALHACRLLANTIRGLSPLLLRRLIIGVIRPVLLWGATLWYHGHRQKTLIAMLQGVLDKACRFLLGVYKGASPHALSFFSSIMPLNAYLPRLKASAAFRVHSLSDMRGW